MIKMKRFAMLLFLVSTPLFFSCNSDDDDTPTQIDLNLISGEWDLTGIKSEDGKASATISNISVNGDYNVSGKDFNAEAIFTDGEPNTFTSSGSFISVASITFATQDPIEYEREIPNFIGAGEWKAEGNILTTIVEGVKSSFEIVSLTEETMSLKVEINETIEQQNITFEITGSQVFTLTKK